MKITVKATLIPAEPSTQITVRVAAGDTVTLAQLLLAEGHSSASVAWGDGETTGSTGGKVAHTYATAGEYVIRISDDISNLTAVGNDTEAAVSAPLIIGFTTNAKNLLKLNMRAFLGCVNLANLSLDEAAITTIYPGAFGGCTTLAGTLCLPSVTLVGGPGSYQPFDGCTGGITEIHFAMANEGSITSCSCYKNDPTLGTGTAVVKFDL